MEPQTSSDDPLISPCQCKGSTRYIHRECLATWRGMKAGTQAHYRCEICHFEYQFRRIWWARLLGHKATAGVLFTLLLAAISAVLGNLRYLWADDDGLGLGMRVALHAFTGFFALGVIGVVSLMHAGCTGRLRERAYQEDSCYALVFNNRACTGNPSEGRCLPPALVFAVVLCYIVAQVWPYAPLVALGLLFAVVTLYDAFYGFVKDSLKHVETMVENIGEPEEAARSWPTWLSRGRGSNSAEGGEGGQAAHGAGDGGVAGAGEGGGSGGVGEAAGEAGAGPSGSAGPYTKAPTADSMV
ncbi:hypothetical protein CHLRE_12g517800v5 [Chlamydomonas reinhardtii]|uniref:RING-CH-type domain-containing protein n=1 Tax=Chlamydomonas reinhardtii TaxID=3055 RepID=A0A2K3D3Y0_CHLRE|nr:uncharacterized protein CHLRE_12g517800v5 [Chlamydomonas reinhardtii]PNW75219.1 hypothetical protein CHLRE_12g517800v5 [Chlamydomonas reinhardtii]